MLLGVHNFQVSAKLPLNFHLFAISPTVASINHSITAKKQTYLKLLPHLLAPTKYRRQYVQKNDHIIPAISNGIPVYVNIYNGHIQWYLYASVMAVNGVSTLNSPPLYPVYVIASNDNACVLKFGDPIWPLLDNGTQLPLSMMITVHLPLGRTL